jgi:Ti-type conjugative transfer relaxase TraA
VALFSLRAQIIGRSRGRSAVAAAAYRAGETLHDERRDRTYSYKRKPGILHSEILAPDGAPTWVYDRSTLWNAAERSERYCNAQVAREIRVALPRELDDAQNLDLVRSFVLDEFVSRGMVADFSIHREKAHNPHAHILLTMRELGPDGFAAKQPHWNSRGLFHHWRAAWEYHANRALSMAGRVERIDRRSYVERGIDLEPEPKLNVARKDERRDGRYTTPDRLEEWKQTAWRNGERIRKQPLEAIKALTSNQATFTRQELYGFLNSKTIDTEQFHACLHAVLQSPDLVQLGTDPRGQERFSARHVIMEEEAFVAIAHELAERRGHHVAAHHVERAIGQSGLGHDQRRALDHITRQTGDVAIIEGIAGTGKSWMLNAARQAWEAEGYKVVGGALAGKAAEGLQESSGIDSRTLASWELSWSLGNERLTSKHVFVVDEAGMIGTPQMLRILREVRKAGAKVILVGDTAQLAAIEAGCPMAELRVAFGAAVLSEVRRQTIDWQRAATLDFAQGRAEQALRSYAAGQCIHASRTQAEAQQAVVEAWQRDRTNEPNITEMKDGKAVVRPATSIILTYRRADVRALNDLARDLRRKNGELGQDVLLQTRDREGQTATRAFATGDRIYFLKNDRALGVMNGSLGTIEKIAGTRLAVRLDNGSLIRFDAQDRDYLELDHGYAATVHKAQGVTVDRAYVLGSRPFDAAATYVAMSRHRHKVELHWSAEEFRVRWSVDTTAALETRGQVALHKNEEVAVAAALREWREAMRRDPREALLVVGTRHDARRLNAQARLIARMDGYLGDDFWTRTDSGPRAFAVGDRVIFTKGYREHVVAAGDLGTIAGRDGAILHLELDDGRKVTLDTRTHTGLDHGYAATFEQSRYVQVKRTIAIASELLTERQREVLEREVRGVLRIHGIEAPAPSADAFLRAMSRVTVKQQAVDVQSTLQCDRTFERGSPLIAHYHTLQTDKERDVFLAKLKRVATKPVLSTLEALRATQEVCDATARAEKAEEELAAIVAAQPAAESTSVARRWFGYKSTLAAARTAAEQEVRRASEALEALMHNAELRERAESVAAAHNAKRGEASQIYDKLTELRERPARERRIEAKVAELNTRNREMTFRMATVADFGKELQFVDLRRLGNDQVVVFSDGVGSYVLFDARRFRSDLAAVQRGARLRVSGDFRVSVAPATAAADTGVQL